MKNMRHTGGEKVGKGSYWNFSTGERVTINAESVLPGDGSVTYYRVNPVVILAAGPVVGLLFAAFLPFIGIAIVLQMLLVKIFTVSMDEVAKVSSFNWSPARAYLAGRRQKKNAEKKMKEEKKKEEEKE
ncbi:MAG: hypothetical protein EPN25_04420 [Nitrospirae bacterium]|nr:MAG: hypothetical protein EPN25_04420 [Nitrospirota bacterium]